MSKAQKKMFKRLKRPEEQEAFVHMLIHQQGDLGHYAHWSKAYAKKLARKDRGDLSARLLGTE